MIATTIINSISVNPLLLLIILACPMFVIWEWYLSVSKKAPDWPGLFDFMSEPKSSYEILGAACCWQMLVLNYRCTSGTSPLNTTCCGSIWRQQELSGGDCRMRGIAVYNLNYATSDGHRGNILALDLTRLCDSGNSIVGRHGATILEVFRNGSFSTTRQVQAFRNLSADRVVLVSRNSDGSQNTDNRNYDHQFDQCKTLLLLHFSNLHENEYLFKTASMPVRDIKQVACQDEQFDFNSLFILIFN